MSESHRSTGRNSDVSDLAGRSIELDHRYAVGDSIYRGPLATLYTGTWVTFDRPVQIRLYDALVRLRLRHRDTMRIKGLVEQTAPRLQGPGLPDIMDVGAEEPMKPFLVMRLPPGDLLANHLKAGRTFEPDEVAAIVDDVALALQACREKGSPHRGPTADRVWVKEDGGAVLLGFGEVLYRDDSLNMGSAPATELVWHLPPEAFAQAVERVESGPDSGEFVGTGSATGRLRANAGAYVDRNAEDSPRAEVYALGCLAYQAINGHHPFFLKLGDPAAGIKATLTDEALDLRGVPADAEFAALVHRAMHRDPEQRFASPAEFAAALDAAFEDEEADQLEEPAPVRALAVGTGAVVDDLQRKLSLWRWAAVIGIAGLLGYIGYDQFRPYSIVITSEPSGLDLVEVVGHTTEPIGRTPAVLPHRSLHDAVQLQVVGRDGEKGPMSTHDPKDFQDLGRCRRLQLQLAFDNPAPSQ
jgi:serine/threonine protein kinase